MSNKNIKWLSKPENFICKIYSKQKHSSKRRGHPQPTYTLKELTEFLLSETDFLTLFYNYLKSDRVKSLAPSVDRLDNSKGYSLCNIRMVTWEENSRAYTPKGIKIKHISNNGVESLYDSICSAAVCLNTSKQRISYAVYNNAKTKIGRFEFI